MRARGSFQVATTAAAMVLASGAHADPTPTVVDIKPFASSALVVADAAGGTYVVVPGGDHHLWFSPGAGKPFYEQDIESAFSNGETGQWSVMPWAPRVPVNQQRASFDHDADGAFSKHCGDRAVALTQLTGDKAKAVLARGKFVSSGILRIPRVLARDDRGTYYYVDQFRKQYGGKGYRVFIGKKGAMKQVPLTDVASDTAGDVFATKQGDLRIVFSSGDGDGDDGKRTATFVRGERRTQLIFLDWEANSPLVFRDLGVYGFLGTICDDV